MKTIRANIFGCLGGVGLLMSCGLLFGVLGGSADALGMFLLVGAATALLGIWAGRERQNIRREKDQRQALEVARAMAGSFNVTVGQQPPVIVQDYRVQFDAAKALIQAKQYSQARALLQTVNHPTAGEWLAKLDKMGV